MRLSLFIIYYFFTILPKFILSKFLCYSSWHFAGRNLCTHQGTAAVFTVDVVFRYCNRLRPFVWCWTNIIVCTRVCLKFKASECYSYAVMFTIWMRTLYFLPIVQCIYIHYSINSLKYLIIFVIRGHKLLKEIFLIWLI